MCMESPKTQSRAIKMAGICSDFYAKCDTHSPSGQSRAMRITN